MSWSMPRVMSGYTAPEAAMLEALHHGGAPEPQHELHFDWCCEHQKSQHIDGKASSVCSDCDGSGGWHEYRRGRAWRFDFAYREYMLAIECEGGTWGTGPQCEACGQRSGGRHTRGKGFEGDCEKYNAATLLGWRVLRFTTDMIEDGRALETVDATLLGTRCES